MKKIKIGRSHNHERVERPKEIAAPITEFRPIPVSVPASNSNNGFNVNELTPAIKYDFDPKAFAVYNANNERMAINSVSYNALADINNMLLYETVLDKTPETEFIDTVTITTSAISNMNLVIDNFVIALDNSYAAFLTTLSEYLKDENGNDPCHLFMNQDAINTTFLEENLDKLLANNFARRPELQDNLTGFVLAYINRAGAQIYNTTRVCISEFIAKYQIPEELIIKIYQILDSLFSRLMINFNFEGTIFIDEIYRMAVNIDHIITSAAAARNNQITE